MALRYCNNKNTENLDIFLFNPESLKVHISKVVTVAEAICFLMTFCFLMALSFRVFYKAPPY